MGVLESFGLFQVAAGLRFAENLPQHWIRFGSFVSIKQGFKMKCVWIGRQDTSEEQRPLAPLTA